jgi:hypothetical protein
VANWASHDQKVTMMLSRFFCFRRFRTSYGCALFVYVQIFEQGDPMSLKKIGQNVASK